MATPPLLPTFYSFWRIRVGREIARSRHSQILFASPKQSGSRDREIATFQNTFSPFRHRMGREIARSRHSRILSLTPESTWVARSRDRDIPAYFVGSRELHCLGETKSILECRALAISRPTRCRECEKYSGMSRSRDLATHAAWGERKVFGNVTISRSRGPPCVLIAGHPFSPCLPLGILSARAYRWASFQPVLTVRCGL